MILRCDNPNDWINDIINGKITLDHVRMDHWVQLVTMAMVERSEVNLRLDIPYKGGLYLFHHCIEQINPPAQVAPLLENIH